MELKEKIKACTTIEEVIKLLPWCRMYISSYHNGSIMLINNKHSYSNLLISVIVGKVGTIIRDFIVSPLTLSDVDNISSIVITCQDKNKSELLLRLSKEDETN